MRLAACLTRPTPRGVSLVEVLVAILVTTVGLLGVAALDALALRGHQQSVHLTTAALRARELADRIHANPVAAQHGQYVFNATPASPPDCLAASCTPAELAQFDFAEWNTTNALVLPAGSGTISLDAVTGVHTITLTWTDGGEAGAESQSLSFEFKPLGVPL